MIIYIWNEHPDMQANKLKREVSFACPTLNQCMQTSMHLGTRSYQGIRIRVLEVMHDKTTSTMQQGIGTNH